MFSRMRRALHLRGGRVGPALEGSSGPPSAAPGGPGKEHRGGTRPSVRRRNRVQPLPGGTALPSAGWRLEPHCSFSAGESLAQEDSGLRPPSAGAGAGGSEGLAEPTRRCPPPASSSPNWEDLYLVYRVI